LNLVSMSSPVTSTRYVPGSIGMRFTNR
jgi:hypothetical protein